MNYEQIYNNLVERAKKRILDEYTEVHHIIPKCMNGTDDGENLVSLTAREHYIAHLLLTKIYKNTEYERKLLWAFNGMCNWKSINQDRDYKFNSYIFENMRGKYTHDEDTKKKISNSNKGKILSESTKKKISETRKQKIKDGIITKPSGSNNGMFGKSHSEETKKKISERGLGIKIKNTEKYSRPGSKNNNAKVIHIFNDKDELIFEANGNFKSVCKDNNLPYAPLYRSYQNGTKLFQNNASIAQAKNSGMIKYQGWYAVLSKN